MPSGNLTGVTPTTGRAKRVVLFANEFGGVAANTWRPLSTGTPIFVHRALPDLYPRSGVKVFVHWSTSNTTTSNTITWRVRWRSMTPDSTDAVTGSFTALDTALVADSVIGTANAYRRTAAGVIAPGRLVADDHYAFEVQVTSASGLTLGDTDNVQFLALELVYAQGGV